MMVDAQIQNHPVDCFFNEEAMPSVWCPGCGIGIAVGAFIQALKGSTLDPEMICVVSGFGCTGRIADYLNLRTHAVEDGYVFRRGAQLSDENPGLKVVVCSNNADLLMSGAEDFIEIRRHSPQLTVIHLNNLFFIVTEKGVIPTTPLVRMTDIDFAELPYNIPLMAKACGASLIARWTPFHAGWLRYSIMDALSRQGLSVIEVVSPCLLYHANERRIGDAVERMKFYNDHSIMDTNIPMEYLDIRYYRKIIVGKFLDRV